MADVVAAQPNQGVVAVDAELTAAPITPGPATTTCCAVLDERALPAVNETNTHSNAR